MGRTKQTKRPSQKKVTDISSRLKRDKFSTNSSQRFWKNGKTFVNPTHRKWIIATGSHDLELVDAELLRDEDGEEVYRVIFTVDKQGRLDWDLGGSIKTCSNTYIRTSFASILSDEWQKKLDRWIQTAKEHVKYIDPRTGMTFEKVEIQPLSLKVPGWESMSPKQVEKAKKAFVSGFMDWFNKLD